jgi:hypothetical protein
MSYDQTYNNTLAIWTAFGGRGRILFSPPRLTWQKRYYNDFGYSKYGSQTQINVYDNGNAQIAVYNAKTPYMSYYNKSTKRWTRVSVPWWSYGEPEVLYSGNGVFLAKITGMANIISSFDGITWYNSGYCQNAYNAMVTGAYDSSRNCGVVGWWYHTSPLYYSYDSLEERTEWQLVGGDGKSVPVFKHLTAHKGNFVGIKDSDKSIATAGSATPGVWTTTIYEDLNETSYSYVRSIHGKLFVMKYRYINGTYQVTLCTMNDSANQIYESNLTHIGDLADNRIPNPKNIIWIEEWGHFALFNEGKLYVSTDGLTWESETQPGFSTSNYELFDGAIYIPGDGFYVKGNGYVYYASYK